MSTRKNKISFLELNNNLNPLASPIGLQSGGLRSGSEKDGHLKYNHLKHLYDVRIEALGQGIKDAFRLVQNDELIETMCQDMTSEEYVNQRVREIIEECINSNREALMEQLSQQIVDLHVQCGNLEGENATLAAQQEELIQEANQKIEEAEMQTQLFREESTNVKAAFHDLEAKYEDLLKRKDEKILERAERDAAELHVARDRIKELESKLKENEKRNWDLSHQKILVDKELETLKMKIKQQDIDRNTLNIELTGSRTREDLGKKRINEYKEMCKGLEGKIENLKRENDGLRIDLESGEMNRKSVEEAFNLKIKQIENGIHEEQDNHKRNIEKLHNRYKEKVEKYKKKILEYKEQMNVKDIESRNLLRKSEENRLMGEKNIEIVQIKLQEQREYYENQIMQIEEENHRKMSEFQAKYDEQLRELQSQFQRVLDQKIDQIQEDAQEQILQVKEQEKEVQELLEEKIMQVEREYIKVTQHEEILLEKDKLVERFKQELGTKEAEYRQDLALKLKGLENRLRDEMEEKERVFKGIQRDFEAKISGLEGEKKKLELELHEKTEEIKGLLKNIDELEAQKNKLFSSIEEWGVKSKKLKEVLEEEQRKRTALENNVREQHENFGEIRALLDETKKEIKDKDDIIDNLEEQIMELKAIGEEQLKQQRNLEAEYEDSRKEHLKREQNQERVIAELRRDKETLGQEKNKLYEKISEMERAMEERVEFELRKHEETQNKLKQVDNKFKAATGELKGVEDEVKRLKGYIQELERENLKGRSTIEDLENAFKETEREKIELEQRIERARLSHEDFKRDMEAVLIDKLRSLRIEFREVESDCLNIINAVKKETQIELETLVNKCKRVIEKKGEQWKNEKENFREKLEMEFGFQLQEIKDEYGKVVKEYNIQLEEKEREIVLLEQKHAVMAEITETLEVDAQKQAQRMNELEEENEQSRSDVVQVRKEKEQLERRMEEMRVRLMDEINNVKRTGEDYGLQRREMEDRYEREISDLNRQNQLLKDKLSQKTIGYEAKMKEMTAKHSQELIDLQRDYEEQLESVSEELGKAQEGEKGLRRENGRLREEIERVHHEGAETERQRQETISVYEAKLDELERDIEDTNNLTKRESQRSEAYVFEKTNEIKRYKKTIQDLEEEVKQRGMRIEGLLEEKGRSIEIIRELQQQLEDKYEELERLRQESSDKSMQQTKEIDQLHKLLIKSCQPANDPVEKRRKKENDVEFNRSVEQLKKLDRYLEHKSPQKSYYLSSARERDIDFPSARNQTVGELKSSREKKYWAYDSK